MVFFLISNAAWRLLPSLGRMLLNFCYVHWNLFWNKPFQGITGILQKDNVKREIPLAYRINLELDIQGAMSSGTYFVVKDLLPQVKCLNLVRCILDRKPVHQYHISLNKYPEVFIWVSENLIIFMFQRFILFT